MLGRNDRPYPPACQPARPFGAPVLLAAEPLFRLLAPYRTRPSDRRRHRPSRHLSPIIDRALGTVPIEAGPSVDPSQGTSYYDASCGHVTKVADCRPKVIEHIRTCSIARATAGTNSAACAPVKNRFAPPTRSGIRCPMRLAGGLNPSAFWAQRKADTRSRGFRGHKERPFSSGAGACIALGARKHPPGRWWAVSNRWRWWWRFSSAAGVPDRKRDSYLMCGRAHVREPAADLSWPPPPLVVYRT